MEFPHLQKVANEFKGKGLTVVTVNQGDSVQDIKRFLAEGKFTLTVAMNERTGRNNAVSAYGVTGFPATFIIGKDGKIRKIMLGFSPETGENDLRKALAEVGFKRAGKH